MPRAIEAIRCASLWVLLALVACGPPGGPAPKPMPRDPLALAALWAQGGMSRDELLRLVTETRGVARPTLAAALFERLGDRAAPRDERLAAIMVLVTWADPRSVPRLQQFEDPGPGDMGFRFWRIDHAVPVSGRASLDDGFAGRLWRALRDVEASDPDPAMRYAARITLASPPLAFRGRDPSVLRGVWSVATAGDSAAVGRLIDESARLRDRRLLDDLLVLITDDARPRSLRMGMLMVLVSHYAPGRILPQGATAEGIDPRYCALGWRLHFESTEGPVPVTGEDRPRILEAVRSLAAADPDPYIRSAAACTAAAMAVVG